MIQISYELQGFEGTVQRFVLYQLALEKRVPEAIREVARLYRDGVRSNELSGGMLNPQSGDLKSSIVVRVKGKGVATLASVYPRVRYGWMLGLGTPKNEVTVRPFLRHLEGAGVATVSYSETKRRRGRGKSTYTVQRTYTRESSVVVKGHTRKMLLAKLARPFMGKAYDRMRAIIEKRLRTAAYLARQDMESGIASGVNPMDIYMGG